MKARTRSLIDLFEKNYINLIYFENNIIIFLMLEYIKFSDCIEKILLSTKCDKSEENS